MNSWKAFRNNRGQSLVELALTLPIVIVLMIGIVDVGFVLYAHVQVAAAAGEGSTVASRILVTSDINHQDSRDFNDGYRRQQVEEAVVAAMGMLDTSNMGNSTSSFYVPALAANNANLTNAANSDVYVSYPDVPTSVTRAGQQVVVTVRYRQPLLFSLVPGFTSARYQVSSSSQARIR